VRDKHGTEEVGGRCWHMNRIGSWKLLLKTGNSDTPVLETRPSDFVNSGSSQGAAGVHGGASPPAKRCLTE
jgi:hypothetical protein